MNFLKRIKPIKVDLYTGHGNAHRLFKPCYAKNEDPDVTNMKRQQALTQNSVIT